ALFWATSVPQAIDLMDEFASRAGLERREGEERDADTRRLTRDRDGRAVRERPRQGLGLRARAGRGDPDAHAPPRPRDRRDRGQRPRGRVRRWAQTGVLAGPGRRALRLRRRRARRHARRPQRRNDALPEPDHRVEGSAARVTRLTIVSLNTAHRDRVFAPVRAIDGVELVHADYRVSWEEISAGRAGRPLPDPEPLPAELAAALARADVVFGFVIPRGILVLAPGVRWIATPATGVDHLRGTGVLESAIPVTTVGGLFGPIIAEHVFAMILASAKRLPHFGAQQRTKSWQMSRVTALEGRTVGLVGVGAIGSAVALRAKAFGMRTIGLGRGEPRGRTIPGVDELVGR